MSTIRKTDVIEALPFLTPEDRAEIVKWCESLGAREFVRGESRYIDTIYDSCAALYRKHHGQHMQFPLVRFARTSPQLYKKLVRAADHMVACCHEWWPDITDVQRVRFLDYLCRVAFDAMTRRTNRTDWASLIGALANIEASINVMFPGWLNCGDFQKKVMVRILSEERRANLGYGEIERQRA